MRYYPGLDSLQTYWETKPERNEEMLSVVRLYHLNSHSPAALNICGAKEGRQEVPHFPLLWQRTWWGRDQQGWGGWSGSQGSIPAVCSLNPGFAALKSVLFQNEIHTSVNNVVSQSCKWVLMSPRGHMGNEVMLWPFGPAGEHNIEWSLAFPDLWEIPVELLGYSSFSWRLDSESIFVCCSELLVGTDFGAASFPSQIFKGYYQYCYLFSNQQWAEIFVFQGHRFNNSVLFHINSLFFIFWL